MVLTHLIQMAGASPWIASFMAQHPVLLDELLDPRTLYLPPEAGHFDAWGEAERFGNARHAGAANIFLSDDED